MTHYIQNVMFMPEEFQELFSAHVEKQQLDWDAIAPVKERLSGLVMQLAPLWLSSRHYVQTQVLPWYSS